MCVCVGGLCTFRQKYCLDKVDCNCTDLVSSKGWLWGKNKKKKTAVNTLAAAQQVEMTLPDVSCSFSYPPRGNTESQRSENTNTQVGRDETRSKRRAQQLKWFMLATLNLEKQDVWVYHMVSLYQWSHLGAGIQIDHTESERNART